MFYLCPDHYACCIWYWIGERGLWSSITREHGRRGGREGTIQSSIRAGPSIWRWRWLQRRRQLWSRMQQLRNCTTYVWSFPFFVCFLFRLCSHFQLKLYLLICIAIFVFLLWWVQGSNNVVLWWILRPDELFVGSSWRFIPMTTFVWLGVTSLYHAWLAATFSVLCEDLSCTKKKCYRPHKKQFEQKTK